MSGFDGKRLWVVALLFGLFVAAELVARNHPSWSSRAKEREFSRAVLTSDPVTGVRTIPNSSITLDNVSYTFSELGALVDTEPSDPADPLILVVSDSYALGWGEEARRAWPARLGIRLRAAQYPARVVNVPVPGANIESHVARVEQLVEKLEPEIVIVGHSPDDAAPAKVPFGSKLALPHVLSSAFANPTVDTIPWFRALHESGSEGWQRVEDAYARLGNLCRSKHLTCAIAVLPATIEGAESMLTLLDRLQEVAERTGVTLVDAAEALRYEPQQWALEPGNPRPGEEGNDRIGATIASWIMLDNLLPHRPRMPTPEPEPAPSDTPSESPVAQEEVGDTEHAPASAVAGTASEASAE